MQPVSAWHEALQKCAKKKPEQKSLRRFTRILLLLSIGILHSVLGLPSECSHNNVIRSCTLSFSCWIQGGRHAEGCGENKWLFSCCISEINTDFNVPIAYNGPMKPGYFDKNDMATRIMPKIKPQMMPSPTFKQNMLRRRMDDNGMVIEFIVDILRMCKVAERIFLPHVSESIRMWGSTNGSQYYSKANYWGSDGTFCCTSMASAHTHR